MGNKGTGAKGAQNNMETRLPGDSRWRLLRLALTTLLAAFALFCLWQAWLIHDEGRAAHVVKVAQGKALQGVEQALQRQRTHIDAALNDTELLADLAENTAQGRRAAQARAHTLLPEMDTIEFYSPTLEEVVHADYRHFGYAKASQLMRLLNNREPAQVNVVTNTHGRQLALAQRVRGGQSRLLGYVWFDWPLATLEKVIKQADPGDGGVALRIGAAPAGLVLLANGHHRALADQQTTGRPVRGSVFWVSSAVPLAPIVLPRHWLWLVVLAIIALLVGAIMLRARFRTRSSTPTPTPSEEPMLSEKTVPAAAATPADADAVPAPDHKGKADSEPVAVEVDASIFRAYDIRGVVGSQLSADVARALGQAIGEVMREKDLTQIVVGRDGRLSGPELAGALAEGLRAAGIDVIDVGAVPTPLVYFAAYQFNTGCGVAVTGSHNPPDYNGFKIVVGGETLSEDAITDLYRRIVAGPEPAERKGNYRQADVIEDYIERVSSDVQAERSLKVVADAGNGIAGEIAPRLLEAIGCEVIPLYCEVDGHFPNHHPDPSDPKNLEDLIQAVQATDADLGVAFDGDGDRLGVVTRAGEIIFPDRVLMLFARDVLSRVPGATVIYDVKCTGHLGPEILQAGGSPLMWRTGHSLIKAKMRETEAQLAGEMSGHFFFRERWYGFDDGLYSASRLLEILASDLDGRDADAIFATLPKGVSTPELKLPMSEGENHPFIARFQKQAHFEGARLTTIDGMRADWSDGWGLVRASNTTPVLVLRFDAANEEALERIQQTFREQLLALDPKLTLPF